MERNPIPPGPGFPFRVYAVFGANPWGKTPPVAVELDGLRPDAYCQPIGSMIAFPAGRYAFNVVMVDQTNEVVDVFSPF